MFQFIVFFLAASCDQKRNNDNVIHILNSRDCTFLGYISYIKLENIKVLSNFLLSQNYVQSGLPEEKYGIFSNICITGQVVRDDQNW